ncbi:hypothetical protein [Rhodosalinus sp. FB01]|uniref:hypothetical protein n=1 Tax=Rhodosalinus sp. FB01 TaxID=3239194 RepID=UPI003523D959
MTTARQMAANRRNAQASTGPRSAAGRRRSSGNARRHGLTAPITEPEVQAMAAGLRARLGMAEARFSAEAHAALLTWARAEVACARARDAELAMLVRHDATAEGPDAARPRRDADVLALLEAFRADGVDPRLLRGLAPAAVEDGRALSRTLRYRNAAETARRVARRAFAALHPIQRPDRGRDASDGATSETNPIST